MTMRRTAGISLLVLVLIGVGTGVVLANESAKARSHRQAVALVHDYLAAWSAGNWSTVSVLAVSAESVDPATYLARTASGLHAASTRVTSTGVHTKGSTGTAGFHADILIRGLGHFSYDGSLRLTNVHKAGWRVEFDETSVFPGLTSGQRLIRTRELPQRGTVLTSDGQPLAPLDKELAANVVGSIGAMTASEAAQHGMRADEGDSIGRSGLEQALDSTLAGVASGSVAIADAAGHVEKQLKTFDGSPGQDVRTTFDLGVQSAGERTLATVTKPAALVAIDTTTGAVKAIVDNPLAGFPRAIIGPYPPGSTFKIIDSTAALMAGRTASTMLDCPKTIKVEGRSFGNAEDEEFGEIPLIEAFAQSCNTAFGNLIQSLPLDAIHNASKLFGFTDSRDTPGPLTIPGVGGFAPAPSDYANAIGEGIGQDQVVASPVQMASVAAAVAAGEWRQPYLLDPAPAHLQHHDIPFAATLREFMAAVVSRGTAKSAGLPPGTFGKTGTAEFGPGPPYKTHAWFIGFRGTTAFALIVEGGGFGGDVAAPLAARFLRYLG